MSYSHGLSTFQWKHPWDWDYLESCSDADLRDVYNQIDKGLFDGDIAPFLVNGVRRTQRKIERILQDRGTSTLDLSMSLNLGGVRGVGFLHRASPSFVVRQTVQQGVINLPAPQPNITIQTNPAPQPLAPLPAPELPKRIRFRDQWGNIVGERDETEQEKSDREYEEWKEKFGAK